MTKPTHPPCPVCGQSGKRVSLLTVESLLVPSALSSFESSSEYRFCATPGCSTVYYTPDQPCTFVLDDISVRVGVKQPGPPTPVCYCFDHTEEELAEEIERTGSSAIPSSISAKVKAGECACETKNPQGICCLGNVRAAVKKAEQSLGVRKTMNKFPVQEETSGKRWNPARWTQAGLLVSAVLASACCWLPLALIGFGATTVGVSAFFEDYRPIFAGLTVVLLGLAFYLAYRPRRTVPQASGVACATDGETCCAVDERGRLPRMNRVNRIMLWPVTAVALAFLFFPNYVGALIGQERTEIANSEAASFLLEPTEGQAAAAEGLGSLAKALGALEFVAGAEVLPDGNRIRVEANTGASAGTETRLASWLQGRGFEGGLVSLQPEVFHVDGMTCAACAAKVSKALWSVDDVGGVSIDEETGEVLLLAIDDPEILLQAAKAVADAGYEVQLSAESVVQEGSLGELGCCTIEDSHP